MPHLLVKIPTPKRFVSRFKSRESCCKGVVFQLLEETTSLYLSWHWRWHSCCSVFVPGRPAPSYRGTAPGEDRACWPLPSLQGLCWHFLLLLLESPLFLIFQDSGQRHLLGRLPPLPLHLSLLVHSITGHCELGHTCSRWTLDQPVLLQLYQLVPCVVSHLHCAHLGLPRPSPHALWSMLCPA